MKTFRHFWEIFCWNRCKNEFEGTNKIKMKSIQRYSFPQKRFNDLRSSPRQLASVGVKRIYTSYVRCIFIDWKYFFDFLFYLTLIIFLNVMNNQSFHEILVTRLMVALVMVTLVGNWIEIFFRHHVSYILFRFMEILIFIPRVRDFIGSGIFIPEIKDSFGYGDF